MPPSPRWDNLGGYEPEGYYYLHDMVWLIAKWGSQGRLPRALGFVHPGDAVDEVLDQPAEVVARAALGTKLAGDLLTAKALFFPSGRQALLPAIYWRSKLGAVTLQDRNSTVDPACFPEVQDEVAHAILHIDAVTDAFEPRWNLPEDGVTDEAAVAAGASPSAAAGGPTAPAAKPAEAPEEDKGAASAAEELPGSDDPMPPPSRDDQVDQVIKFAREHKGWSPDLIYKELKKSPAFRLSRDRVRKLAPRGAIGRRSKTSPT